MVGNGQRASAGKTLMLPQRCFFFYFFIIKKVHIAIN